MSALLGWRRAHPVLFRGVATVVLTMLALLLTWAFSGLTDYTLAQAASYAIVILGLSFLTGMSGQVSLGNGAFMGVGALTAGIWANHHSTFPIVGTLAVSTLIGAAVGLVVGLPATRLRGPYLAGLTIAISVAFSSIVDEFGSLTGGEQGLSLPSPLGAPGWLVSLLHSTSGSLRPNEMWVADVAIVTTAVAFFLMANLFQSRVGRGMRLMRENEVAAELAGVSLPRARVLAFVVASACAGLGGGLFMLVGSVANPSLFTLTLSIEFLTFLVIGGIGTLTGALIGGVLVAYSNQWITSLVSTTGLDPTGKLATNLNGIIFGGLLIMFVLALPLGIAGTPRFVISRRRRPPVTALAPVTTPPAP